jgi:hypothetical protein
MYKHCTEYQKNNYRKVCVHDIYTRETLEYMKCLRHEVYKFYKENLRRISGSRSGH